ncbi:MAG TPA: alpha/beta fold hydrolase [Limnobacter sp.]|nr:alpha/beta fold hydrolase [Limnobacter sp.]
MRKPDQTVCHRGIEIAIYQWGTQTHPNDDREVIVLAHGFPDRAVFWDKVATELSNRYRVVAFDMRGCGNSSPVTGTRAYRFDELLEDLFAVIDTVSPGQRVHLVGHDWGGIYGWDAISTTQGQQRIASFSTLSPSLDHVAQFFRQRIFRPTPVHLYQLLRQCVRNSLMVFFALPVLPALFFASGAGTMVFKWLMQALEPTAGFQAYPGLKQDAIRFLGIYRANLFGRMLMPRQLHTSVPVMAIQAEHDPFLPPLLFEHSSKSANIYSATPMDASHWAPLSRSKPLAHLIGAHIEFVNKGR